MTTQTWFITGASRGIGLALAQAALAAGHRVAATSRRSGDITRALGEHANLLPLDLDVTDAAQIRAAVEVAQARFDSIDVLVNNAGYGQLGLFEDTTAQDARTQFDTNVFGLFEVTRAVLPVMRAQRRGHIFNVSSIGGIAGFASATLYCASKFGVEGFSASLAEEVRALGIAVTVVGPGFIRTDFLESTSVRFAGSAVADYAALSAQLRDYYAQQNQQQAGDPARLAQALLQLAASPTPPARFSAGSDALELFDTRLAQLQQDRQAWAALSASVDGQWS
jgi:NAD(P)-dependent dehydrogenase (short-subunit alcohol dehydrogenase family)